MLKGKKMSKNKETEKDSVVEQVSNLFGDEFANKLGNVRKKASLFKQLDEVNEEIKNLGDFLDLKGEKTFGAKFYMKLAEANRPFDLCLTEGDLTEEEYDEMFALSKKIFKRHIDELFNKRVELNKKIMDQMEQVPIK